MSPTCKVNSTSSPLTELDLDIKPPRKIIKINKHRQQKFRDAWLKNEDYKQWLSKVPGDLYKAKCRTCNVIINAELTVIKNHMTSKIHLRKALASQHSIYTFIKKTDEISTKAKATQALEIKLDITPPRKIIKINKHRQQKFRDAWLKNEEYKQWLSKVPGEQYKAKCRTCNVIINAQLNVIKNHMTSKIHLQKHLASQQSINTFIKTTDEISTKAKATQALEIKLDITPPRKIIKINKHRQQKFRDAWLKNEDYKQWLSKVPGEQYKAECRTCNVIINAELTVIKNHMTSKIHLRKHLASQQPINTFIEKTGEISTKAQALEIKLCGFLAEHNISFTTLDHLTTILKSSVPDSEIVKNMQMKSTKGTAIVKNVIAEAEKEYLQKKLQISRFSVLIDKSDIGGIQTMSIIVRYFDAEEGRVVSKFWDLSQIFEQDSEVESAMAEYLFGLVMKSFEDYEIPLENIIGFASDGASTMMGKDNSVASRFLEKCPGIYIFKGICHSLHLCVTNAYPVLKLVSYLNPSKAMLRKTRDIVPSLLPLMKALPRIASSDQHQIIDDEWRQLPSFELPAGVDVNDPVDIFWAKLLECEEGDQGMTFKNVSKFVLETISLPHSNADSERIFSKINLIKTKARKKLAISTVKGVLLAKQRVRGKENDCTTYEPSQSEYSRMNKALLYKKKITTESTAKKFQDLVLVLCSDADVEDFYNILKPNDF